MLPRLLCEELCSLNPGVERFAFSAMWQLDEDGEVVSEWFGRSVIRSCAKLDYGAAQRMIETAGTSAGAEEWAVEALPLHGGYVEAVSWKLHTHTSLMQRQRASHSLTHNPTWCSGDRQRGYTAAHGCFYEVNRRLMLCFVGLPSWESAPSGTSGIRWRTTSDCSTRCRSASGKNGSPRARCDWTTPRFSSAWTAKATRARLSRTLPRTPTTWFTPTQTPSPH